MLAGWRRRRQQYQAKPLPVPVIVVGNLTVGGSGKTPITAGITHLLLQQGWHPGIVSRGYGSTQSEPRLVESDNAQQYGDEAVCLRRQTGVPVAVGHDRHAVANLLLFRRTCNVIVSDDGLQHYRLHRDVEIIAVDAIRRLGNGQCLPAGPLRERASRLQQSRFVVSLGGKLPYAAFQATLVSRALRKVHDRKEKSLLDFRGRTVHAVAGIAHPQRFFEVLRHAGLQVIGHDFADHHQFCVEDLQFNDTMDIIMTEKDAVKCAGLAPSNSWYLPVYVELEQAFNEAFIDTLNQLRRFHGQTAAGNPGLPDL